MKNLSLKLMVLVIAMASIQSTRKGYEVGDVVGDFNLKNVDGNLVSLSDYKEAKGFIIVFDCNSCPVSKLYNKRIIALHKKYSSSGFPVVAINANDAEKSPEDSYEQMVKEAKEKEYEFAYLYDQSQEIAQVFGATNTPQAFILVKKDAALKVAYIGAIDNNARDGSKADKKYVENVIEALLKNQPFSVTKTKAIGCGIRWKDA
jgi:glutathione peroxidase-family protein